MQSYRVSDLLHVNQSANKHFLQLRPPEYSTTAIQAINHVYYLQKSSVQE